MVNEVFMNIKSPGRVAAPLSDTPQVRDLVKTYDTAPTRDGEGEPGGPTPQKSHRQRLRLQYDHMARSNPLSYPLASDETRPYKFEASRVQLEIAG